MIIERNEFMKTFKQRFKTMTEEEKELCKIKTTISELTQDYVKYRIQKNHNGDDTVSIANRN